MDKKLNKTRRGRCGSCQKSQRLKRDGNLERHAYFDGTRRYICVGSGHPPEVTYTAEGDTIQ